MKNSSISGAVARAAMHCDELLSRAATPPELDIEFARFVSGFAENAQLQLAELCDDRGIATSVVATELLPVGDWYEQMGNARRHSYFSLGQESRGILVSVGIGELVAQFERILGGSGEVDERLGILPASAARFAHQFDDRVCEAMRRTSDRREISASAIGDEAEDVAPFALGEKVWTATIAISSSKSDRPWQVRLAACQSMIAELVEKRAASPATGRTIGARGIGGSAIADVDLPLRAVLVDVPMSIARLASLEPGAVIQVAVNRSVPLQIGQLTIAHGCVGELDDRVALELTHTSFSE
ncbi:hypothetical protein ED21_25743 [Erythrobacter sp. SD-21]|nr:hypothetical protein ED21_25743 [Erythrobacter sp. SD-21]